MQKIIPKKDFNNFVEGLIKKYEVVAPIEDGTTKWGKISRPDEIYTYKITEVPAKTHFLPENETILEIKNGTPKEVEGDIKKTVLFGLRRCDLNGIQVLDKVMKTKQYWNKRKNTILVGLFCDHPDEYCFCNSMELEDYYDLFIYPKGDNYYITIGTKAGESLVKDLKENKSEFKIPNPKNFKKLTTLDIEDMYRNSEWEKDANNCLSCSACTAYCPTCNCYDVEDSVDLLGKNGKRTRKHSSCMTKSFSEVAGGHTFRSTRLSRFKQFVYHKIDYFKKQKGRPMCVGCGRCLRVCPTKIDWVDTINKMNTRV